MGWSPAVLEDWGAKDNFLTNFENVSLSLSLSREEGEHIVWASQGSLGGGTWGKWVVDGEFPPLAWLSCKEGKFCQSGGHAREQTCENGHFWAFGGVTREISEGSLNFLHQGRQLKGNGGAGTRKPTLVTPKLAFSAVSKRAFSAVSGLVWGHGELHACVCEHVSSYLDGGRGGMFAF